MRRYLCEKPLGAAGSSARLSRELSHHLLRVNLTPRGTTVILFDQNGLQARARLEDVVDDCAIFLLTESPQAVPQPSPLVLVQGQPKRPAMEHILRMATELGVTEIRVFHGIHSIAKGEKLSRWERVVDGCVAQCGRTSSPVLLSFQNLEAALTDLPEGPRLACIPGSKIPSNRPDACVLLIGPEGGLHADELSQAERAGFTTLGLGELVLRCDTAVAAALGLVLRS